MASILSLEIRCEAICRTENPKSGDKASQSVINKEMSTRFYRAVHQGRPSEQVRQSLEEYRRKIRFKQVKFSIIVLAWQVAILILRYEKVYNLPYN